jgi:hypothetical protein
MAVRVAQKLCSAAGRRVARKAHPPVCHGAAGDGRGDGEAS